MLGGSDHMEDDDQDRGDEEIGQEVETHEREEEIKHEETTNAQTHDDMWMNMFLWDTRCDTLSQNVV